jgi:hypothetical protein
MNSEKTALEQLEALAITIFDTAGRYNYKVRAVGDNLFIVIDPDTITIHRADRKIKTIGE